MIKIINKMANNSGSGFFFIANLMNFVLATAVFTIPYPMYEVGIILGPLILATTCFVSVIACQFIIEALAMKNCIKKKEDITLDKAIESESESDKKEPFKGDELASERISGIESTTSKETLINKDGEESDDFYIKQRYEISKLSKILPKPLYFFVVITIICYLYVGVTSNGIIAATNLLDIIGKTIGTVLPDYYYYVIISVFFFFTICVALNNIKHLKKFSMFIMIMRILVISLIIGCCIYSMVKYQVTKFSELKKFDISNITVMIGNSLFVFMSHHSIPGMVENFSPQKHLMKLLIIGYFCCFLFMVGYGYLALFAFGSPSLPCDKSTFPSAIYATFSSNFLGIKVIGHIINYYPILNVITSGMQLITLRNNILEAIGGCSISTMKKLNFAEQKGCNAIIKSFFFNLLVAIPPITVGVFIKNIQTLMKYFSSVLGFLLMLIVPVIVVNGFRKHFAKRKFKKGKLNQSFMQGIGGNIFIGIMSVVIFSLVIFGFINSVQTKDCVNQNPTFRCGINDS